VQRFAEKSPRNEFLTLYSFVNETDSALIVDIGWACPGSAPLSVVTEFHHASEHFLKLLFTIPQRPRRQSRRCVGHGP